MEEKALKKKRGMDKFLDFIEKGGNKLPHPATIFLILAIIVAIVATIMAASGASVTYTALDRKTLELGEKTLKIKALLNPEGIRYIFGSMVKNFTGFEPLGTVLVALIGIGVAEGSGLIGALLRKVVLATPPKLITAVVVLAGVVSNIASDAGYVILIPLGALVFLSVGRHPLAGMAAAFAGVSGGFSANLFLGTLDPLLSGLTTEAARLMRPGYFVNPACNYYFMFISTFILTLVGVIITEKLVEPRLGKYEGDEVASTDALTPAETRGLRMAGLSLIIFAVFMVVLTIPENAILRVDGRLKSWIYHGLVPTLMLFFLIPGITYGASVGTIKNDKDIAKMMGKSLATMGGYLVLVFTAAQFIKWFSYSNLGTYLAVNGATFLKSVGLTGIPLILLFIIVAAFLNLFMGSASAKWAIMAPVFVPMFMQLGYSPEFTQLAYRIGDSSTNIISPLMSYFAMIIAFAQKYDKNTGMGTLISIMLPYSIAFLIFWSALLAIWMTFGLPIGIDGAIKLAGL